MILFGMEDAENDEARANDLVKYLVRKPAKKDAAEIAVVNSLAFGIQFQRPHGMGKFIQQFATEAGSFRSYQSRAAARSRSASARTKTTQLMIGRAIALPHRATERRLLGERRS